MEEFMRKFTQLNGIEAEVILEHCLFDKQKFICPSLKTIDDDKRVGILLRSHEIFLYKQDVKNAEICGYTYTISDGRLKISIICKKN